MTPDALLRDTVATDVSIAVTARLAHPAPMTTAEHLGLTLWLDARWPHNRDTLAWEIIQANAEAAANVAYHLCSNGSATAMTLRVLTATTPRTAAHLLLDARNAGADLRDGARNAGLMRLMGRALAAEAWDEARQVITLSLTRAEAEYPR